MKVRYVRDKWNDDLMMCVEESEESRPIIDRLCKESRMILRKCDDPDLMKAIKEIYYIGRSDGYNEGKKE